MPREEQSVVLELDQVTAVAQSYQLILSKEQLTASQSGFDGVLWNVFHSSLDWVQQSEKETESES